MAIIQAFVGALSGTFADQWRDIVTAGPFDETTVVTPGVHQSTNRGRGTNYKGSVGVITHGSRIFVPENTAAFVFSQGGIEAIITVPGGYVYESGQSSIFSGGGWKSSIIDQIAERVTFGGQTPQQRFIGFVNLREVRGLRFGTKGPLVYHDKFYGADLEITSFGSFSIQVVDPVTFVRNFVPANTYTYTFKDPTSRRQLSSEFLQSLTAALNSLSDDYRISHLPSLAHELVDALTNTDRGVGTWLSRFGLRLVGVGTENIEFTDESRELVRNFSQKMMDVKAYEGLSPEAVQAAAQQRIAKGIEAHGLGDGGGMLFGLNVAQAMAPQASAMTPPTPAAESTTTTMSMREQIEMLTQLKELVDLGLLTEQEFTLKKNEIMGF